jgi:hypothetical protein
LPKISHEQPMPSLEQKLDADLAAIRRAISDGNAEEAKAKIRSVSLNVSPGSRLTKEIGELYLELGFSAMAGRYWYLLEDKSDQMIAACEEFERSLGNSPVLIMETLGWCPERSSYATAKMDELRDRAKVFRRQHHYNMKPTRDMWDRVALVGCGVVGFVLLFVFIAGIMFIVTWFR